MSGRTTHSQFVSIFAALALLVVLTGSASTPTGASAAVSQLSADSAVVGADQEPPCLNLLLTQCSSAATIATAGVALPGAFRIRPDFSYEPVLVDRVDVKRNPAFTLTYHIDEDAVWSDGTPLTADDFLFTLEAIVDPANQIATRAGYDLIVECIRLNDRLVRFVFAKPYAAWRRLFPTIYPKHALEGRDLDEVWLSDLDDPATGEPIGSGPFLVTDWAKGVQLTMTRNPRWWGAHLPQLDSIVFRFIPFSSALIEALRNGEVDLISPQPSLALAELRTAAGLVVESSPGSLIEHLDFNVGSLGAPLARQVWFRQAVGFSLDRGAVVRALWDALSPGLPVQQSLSYSSVQDEYIPSFARYTYDPTKVAEIMSGQGCVTGADGIWVCDGERASLRFATTSGNALRALAQQLLQEQAAAAGIELVPDNATAGVLFGTRLPARDYELIMFSWLIDGDPRGQVERYGCAGRSNFMDYCSPQVTELLTSSDAEVDPEDRAELVNAAAGILAEEVPSIPLFLRPTFLAYSARLHGPSINPSPQGPTWNVEEWRLD